MEGSHSPFGFIWQIASQTGWSIRYILWKVPYATLLMMLSDAPRYISGTEARKQLRKQTSSPDLKSGEKKSGTLEFFQTRLGDRH